VEGFVGRFLSSREREIVVAVFVVVVLGGYRKGLFQQEKNLGINTLKL